MLSFANDNDFNLIFIRNGIHLDCYGYDNKRFSSQVKYICSSSNKKVFEDSILSYLRYYSHLKSIVGLSDYLVLKVLKSELNKGLLVSEATIKQISNKPNELCFAYYKLPSKQGRIKVTPSWDTFFAQFDVYQAKIFRAWIYSIFVEKDTNRQILWVEGEGYTGKSTVASVIGEILSSYNDLLFNSLSIEKETDKINLVNFDKCRFAVFSNVMRDSRILQRQEILLLTGNDYTKVKKLYHDPENKKIFAKIMVNSNFSPQYNDKITHERTRIIHLKMDKELIAQTKLQWREEKVPFNERLKKEFNDFMKKASVDYKDLMLHTGLLKI